MIADEERLAALLEAELETQAVRAGYLRSFEREHNEALFLSSSFMFDSAEDAAMRFSGAIPDSNIYSRYTNPTVRAFEQRIALMEGAEAAVATSSGMAAILSTCVALLEAGDHIVCSRSVFGSTVSLFDRYLAKLGMEISYVDGKETQQWQQAIKSNTRLFFAETPSNPLAEIIDIAAVAAIAHQADILFVVDNCFCTPVLQQPLKLGADLVVHSATKFIDGQGRCLGGVVCGAKELTEKVLGFVRTTGPSMSPFNAWVFLKGLETLSIRMKAHCESAMLLAKWLEQQELIEKVHYAGLESHPQHDLAAKQQSQFGAVLSFQVKGGKENAWRFIDATRIFSITANLGDAKSTIIHPATTTHGRLSDQQRAESGVADNLIRISVGLENVKDLQADLQRGLQALQKA